MKFIRHKLLSRIIIAALGVLLVAGLWLGVDEFVLAQGTNTVVFTGQVIPAFEGAAYDPTLAYQYLSGLPIYVFVYDRWSGDPTNDWIVNNRIVRTQIRADGSFQAMGLPHGANYGVYFPYKEVCYDLPNYTGTARDCWDPSSPSGATRNVARMDGLTVEPQRAPFRSPIIHDITTGLRPNNPIYSDQIADVFSYGFIECGAACGNYDAVDQFGEPVTIEERYVFVTSTNRLDIQSHINIFPLVPATSLKIAVEACSGGLAPCATGGHLEVYAQRIVRRATPYEITALDDLGGSCGAAGYTAQAEDGKGIGATNDNVYDSCNDTDEVLVPTEPLIISGRTTRIYDSRTNSTKFNAFAPPGYYAITVWRSDEGVPYYNYRPNGYIGTPSMAVGFLFVDNPTDSYWQRLSTGVDSYEDEGVAEFAVPSLSARVWGRVMKLESLSSLVGRNIRVMQPDITIAFESVGVGGSFAYLSYADHGTAPGQQTNRFGVFAVLSTSNSEAHGLKVGVNHEPDVYLQTLDIASISPNYSAYQTQDFTLRQQQSAGYFAKTGVELGTGGDKGVNGVAVSTVCTTCAMVQSGEGEVSTYRGQTGYRYPLTDAEPGYFYFPPDWFVDNEDYLVTFSTSELTAVCKLTSGDIEQMKISSADPLTASVDMGDDCTFDPNLGAYRNPHIILYERPATITAALANLHIPNVLAQEANVTCLTGELGKSFTGTFGVPGANLTGWEFTGQPMALSGITAVDTAATKQVDRMAEDLAGAVGGDPEMWEETSRQYWDKNRDEFAQPLGNITVAEDRQSYNWFVPCEDLEDIADTAEVRLQVTASEPGGSFSLAGQALVHIKAVYSGRDSVGYHFSSLSPDIILEPTCPEAKGTQPSTWLPHYMCKAVKGVAGMVPGMFEFLQTTLLYTAPLTESPAVIAIWNVMRNLANVFTVAILFVIGIMTVFRINPKEFQPGAALGALLVSLILVNFSLLLCEVFIDANNVLVVYIFDVFEGTIRQLTEQGMTLGGSLGAFSAISGMGAALAGNMFGTLTSAIVITGGTAGTAAIGFGPGLLMLLVGLAVALLSILIGFLVMYMIRYAVIWLCVIIAPLVFFLSNVPGLKGVRQAWFKLFIGFTLIQTMSAIVIGVGMALLLGLGGDVGFWQTTRQLMIGTAVLFLGIKSPSTILGVLGLDLGAGALMSQAGKLAAPLQKGLGEVGRRYGTGEGMLERKKEWAAKEAYYRGQGVSEGGIRFRRMVGGLPGVSKIQEQSIAAQRLKRQAAVAESKARKEVEHGIDLEKKVSTEVTTSVETAAYSVNKEDPRGYWQGAINESDYNTMVHDQLEGDDQQKWDELAQKSFAEMDTTDRGTFKVLAKEGMSGAERGYLGVSFSELGDPTEPDKKGGRHAARQIAAISRPQDFTGTFHESFAVIKGAPESQEAQHLKEDQRRVVAWSNSVRARGARAVATEAEQARVMVERTKIEQERLRVELERNDRLEQLLGQMRAERPRVPQETIEGLEKRLQEVQERIDKLQAKS